MKNKIILLISFLIGLSTAYGATEQTVLYNYMYSRYFSKALIVNNESEGDFKKVKDKDIRCLSLRGKINGKDLILISKKHKNIRCLDLSGAYIASNSEFPDFPYLEVLFLSKYTPTPECWQYQLTQGAPSLRVLMPFYDQRFTTMPNLSNVIIVDQLKDYNARGRLLSQEVDTIVTTREGVCKFLYRPWFEPKFLSYIVDNSKVVISFSKYISDRVLISSDVILPFRIIPEAIHYKDSNIQVCKISPYTKRIQSRAFSNCPNLSVVQVASYSGQSKDTIYIASSAFANCNSLAYIEFDRPVVIYPAQYVAPTLPNTSCIIKFNEYVRIMKNANLTVNCDSMIFASKSEIESYAFTSWSKVNVLALEKETKIERRAFYNIEEVQIKEKPYHLDTLFADKNGRKGYGKISIPVNPDIEIKNSLKEMGFFKEVKKILPRGNHYRIELPKRGHILDKIPLQELSSIDSLTIVGNLNEDDLKIIRACKNLQYLDIEYTYILLESDEPDVPLSLLKAKNINQIMKTYKLCHCQSEQCKGMTKLEEVKLPFTIDKVSYCAFAYCRNLSKIKFPVGLKSIGTGAFGYCTSLKELNFPVQYHVAIGEQAFYHCENIQKIVLYGAYADESSFMGCSGIKELHLGDSRYISTRMGNNEGVIIHNNRSDEIRITKALKNCEVHVNAAKVEVDRDAYGTANCTFFIPKGSLTSYYSELGFGGNKFVEK